MDGCDVSYCSKCKGMMKLAWGILILINVYWWPRWTGIDGWLAFFGWLFVIFGIIRWFKPCCSCCAVPAAKAKKK